MVVLHDHEIRKEKGQFRFANRLHKDCFIADLTQFIAASEFVLICCAVDKIRLQSDGRLFDNPYHIALGVCLEALYCYLQERQQECRGTHVIVECRGKKEDAELKLEFLRICAGENRIGKSLPFELVFADKRINSAGLQMADLVARPVGMSVIRPDQSNRAFALLRQKLYAGAKGSSAAGLTIYP